MLQVFIRLAAIDDAILTAVYLEQEKHVMFIDLTAVIALHQLVDSGINDNKFIK